MLGKDDDLVSNNAYDEAIPVETDDEEMSTPPSSAAPSPNSQQKSPAMGGGQQSASRDAGKKRPDQAGDESGSESSSDDGSSTSSSSAGGNANESKGGSGLPSNAYNPEDYKGMDVSSEIKDLFQYITRYKPHTIELDMTFKPFIPELIPSIGEVDAFLKMPRPDGEPSSLGTTCLDEPSLNPTDPSILDLQLRSLSKLQDLEPMEVRSIENAEKNPKEIENWVKRVSDLNRQKPATMVQYSKRMPDIEQLMQVWPAEFEEYLQQNPLPDLADLELDLASYIRIFASILDVPVYNNNFTETLHVIFTLYSEFKSNQHFSKTETTGNFGQNDPYNFGPGPNAFAQGTSGAMSAAQAQNMFGGPMSTSMAPSRAPSPVGDQNQGILRPDDL